MLDIHQILIQIIVRFFKIWLEFFEIRKFANLNSGDKSFGCPETMKKEPLENFSCQKQIYASLLNQKLMNPIGAVYVYSDLR